MGKKLSERQLTVAYTKIFSQLKFINDEIIPAETWLISKKIAKGIDKVIKICSIKTTGEYSGWVRLFQHSFQNWHNCELVMESG